MLKDSRKKERGNLINQLRVFVSIVVLMGSILFLPAVRNLLGHSPVALAASDPVIAAAGDIACDPTNSGFNGGNGVSGFCHQKYTSDLLVNAGLAAVLPLGDNQYYCGGYQAFLQSYDLSWGRVKSITHPVVGNHEYLTSGGTDCTIANEDAAGYFNYFGAAAGNPGQGYYSYDIGTWHLIALNSNCTDVGGCGSSSPQGQWLTADLAAHSNWCTLAYWHIPRFSSGSRAELNTRDLWYILYDHDADLILNGHDHIYERFAPQAPDGTADSVRGIREFIVGSGGANHTSLAGLAANSEVRNVDTYGVLKLTLHPTSYDWQFVPETGQTFTDSGTQACHGSGPPPGSPTPTGADVNMLIGGASQGNLWVNNGQSQTVSYPGVSSGPVNMISTNNVPLVGSERVIYKVNGIPTSFSEMMALPNSQLNTIYWLPWYNNIDLDTQLRFANVSGSTATVHVWIGGVEMNDSPFTLSKGQSTRKSFVGVNKGPVKIVSNVNIVAAERVIYKVNGIPTSFSEMMGLPNSQLSTTYWLTWYNNVDLDTQLRIGNVSNTTATVHVWISGHEMTSGCTPSNSPYTLTAGASLRVSCPGVNNGPVQIVSNVNVVAAERVIYKVNNIPTSFSEMMALPDSQLSTSFWLPWYNNIDLDSQLRFGVP
jgi:hypothetical protein